MYNSDRLTSNLCPKHFKSNTNKSSLKTDDSWILLKGEKTKINKR